MGISKITPILRHPLLIVVVVFLGLFALSRTTFSISQITTNKTEFFTVTETGKVTVIPDIAEISLGIEARHANLKTAQLQTNQTINALVTDLKKLLIDSKDIQTTNYYIYPNYDYTSKASKITSYTVSTTIFVRVRNLEKINEVIDTATNHGINQISNLRFSVSELEKYQNQAREEAIKKAKAKASLLAAQAGITLGKIVNISESGGRQDQPIFYAREGISTPVAGEGTQVQPGSSEITSTVTLLYETR